MWGNSGVDAFPLAMGGLGYHLPPKAAADMMERQLSAKKSMVLGLCLQRASAQPTFLCSLVASLLLPGLLTAVQQ